MNFNKTTVLITLLSLLVGSSVFAKASSGKVQERLEANSDTTTTDMVNGNIRYNQTHD